MLVALVALTLGAPADVFAPPSAAASDCWVNPLELRLSELAEFGRVAGEVVRNNCVARYPASVPAPYNRSLTVTRTRLTRFNAFGEDFGLELDSVVQPGDFGRPDQFYVVPHLELPEAWQRTIDTATYPVLLVGTAAIATGVIIELLGHHR